MQWYVMAEPASILSLNLNDHIVKLHVQFTWTKQMLKYNDTYHFMIGGVCFSILEYIRITDIESIYSLAYSVLAYIQQGLF